MMTTRSSRRRRVNQGDPEVRNKEKRSPQGGDDKHRESAENETEKRSLVVVFAHGAGAPSSSDWMIREKRRATPIAEKLFDFHSDITRKAMEKYPGHPLVLAGNSMGSRARMVKYETLLQLTVPVMSVQGRKDGLCPLEQLESVMKKMKSINELHVIQGGDRTFKIASSLQGPIRKKQND